MLNFTRLINILITLEAARLHYVARFKTADQQIDTILARAGYSKINGFTWKSGPFRASLTQAEGLHYRMRLTVVRPEHAQNIP